MSTGHNALRPPMDLPMHLGARMAIIDKDTQKRASRTTIFTSSRVAGVR